MEKQKEYKSVTWALIALVVVVLVVAAAGMFLLGHDDEVIQGQMEASEYRVSSKVPSRSNETSLMPDLPIYVLYALFRARYYRFHVVPVHPDVDDSTCFPYQKNTCCDIVLFKHRLIVCGNAPRSDVRK